MHHRIKINRKSELWTTNKNHIYHAVRISSKSKISIFTLPNQLTKQSSFWKANSHEVKKFPAYYGICRFITVLKRACHLSLSSARSIQSINSHPISLRTILILDSHIRYVYHVVSLPMISPPKPCMNFSSLPRVTCASPISLFLI